MRTRRSLPGLVCALVLAATPVLAAAGAAHSADGRWVAMAAEELPERTISSKIVEKRNVLVLKGNVSPGHANRPVFIQKRNCLKKSCEWHKFAKVITNDNGGFHSRVTAPRKGSDFWRAMVKAHDGYAQSYSQVWRTYTI